MRLGSHHTGSARVGSRRTGGYEPHIEAGNCDNGSFDACLILSKTSIPLDHTDCTDPAALLDFFGSSATGSCLRNQQPSSFSSEPATPNGFGDSVVSHSPIVGSRPRRSYGSGRTPLAPLAEDSAANVFQLSRQSSTCTEQIDGKCHVRSVEAPHSAPVLGSKLHATGASFSLGVLSGLAEATGDSAAAPLIRSVLADVDLRARTLEKQLQEKCDENQALAQQLQQRDDELQTIRAELERLRVRVDNHASCQQHGPVAPTALRPSLLAQQLQQAKQQLRARDAPNLSGCAEATLLARRCRHASLSAGGVPPVGCAEDVGLPPCTPSPPLPAPSAGPPVGPCSPGPLLHHHQLQLLRVDTPQTPDALTHIARVYSEASQWSMGLSPSAGGTAAAPRPSAGVGEAATKTHAPVAQRPVFPAGVVPPAIADMWNDSVSPASPPLSSSPASPRAPEPMACTLLPSRPSAAPRWPPSAPGRGIPSSNSRQATSAEEQPAAALGPAVPAPPALIEQLVLQIAAERRHTDRAHKALVFSSRQAQRLSLELQAARAHAAALQEELRDWRAACLDNHRQLSRLRKEAAARAAAAAAAVVSPAGSDTEGSGVGRD